MFTNLELKEILNSMKFLYDTRISSRDQKKIRLSIINKIQTNIDFKIDRKSIETNSKSKYLFK